MMVFLSHSTSLFDSNLLIVTPPRSFCLPHPHYRPCMSNLGTLCWLSIWLWFTNAWRSRFSRTKRAAFHWFVRWLPIWTWRGGEWIFLSAHTYKPLVNSGFDPFIPAFDIQSWNTNWKSQLDFCASYSLILLPSSRWRARQQHSHLPLGGSHDIIC